MEKSNSKEMIRTVANNLGVILSNSAFTLIGYNRNHLLVNNHEFRA